MSREDVSSSQKYSPSKILKRQGIVKTRERNFMTECVVVQRSRECLACSAVIPRFFEHLSREGSVLRGILPG